MTMSLRSAMRVGLVALVSVLLVSACARRNVDYDGRRDRNDNPQERVCCKIRTGEDFVTTRARCFRRNGVPVRMRRCRID